MEDYRHWQLFRASRHGDVAAAAAFESYWRPQARRFFGHRFGRDQADELTCAFFERAYRLAPARFTWPCPFSAYLRTMLLNLARDHVSRTTRVRQRESSLEAQPWIADKLVDSGLDPEAECLRAERRAALQAAIAVLPRRDRELLLAWLLDGASPDVLAEREGVSRDAIYQRLCRARKRLKATVLHLREP